MKKEQMKTKICKHCKTEIPKGAKVCPQCRKKQKMGLLPKIIIVIIVIAVLGSAFGGSDDSADKSKTTTTTDAQTDTIKKDVTETKEENDDSNLTMG